MINYKDLKKNDRIKSNQIGVPITGKLMESPKQGKGLKKVILIWTNGSEVGMFDEHGSFMQIKLLKSSEMERGTRLTMDSNLIEKSIIDSSRNYGKPKGSMFG